jgi:tetratricopeptide (TPR) repeat protein
MMHLQQSHSGLLSFTLTAIMAAALLLATLVRGQTVTRNMSSIQITRRTLSSAATAERWSPDAIPVSNLPVSYAVYSLDQNDPGQTNTLLEMLQTYPNHPLLAFALGYRYYQAGDVRKALQHWRSVPDVDMYFANRSTLAMSNQDEQAAVIYADLSRQILPQESLYHIPMARDLCKWFAERKQYEKALPWCSSFAALDPSPSSNIYLANMLAGAGNLPEAIDVLTRLVESEQPEANGQAYFLLGEFQRRQANYEAARISYENSLQSGYVMPWVLISLANTYRQLGDIPKACEVYGAAIRSGYTADAVNQSNFSSCER